MRRRKIATIRPRPTIVTAIAPAHAAFFPDESAIADAVNGAVAEHGRIDVMARQLPDGGAQIEVVDTGGGIREAELPLIFDRFYRVEGPHASGSGLGLAIARELAERMGGSVELASAPGRATFTLSLPAAAVAAGELAVST